MAEGGVLEEGQLSYPDAGTPEGGVISPLLANVFLHYVLDEWFAQQVQPRLRGPSTLVRYCDDFVMLFAYKDDAERVSGSAREAAGEVRAATAPGQDPHGRFPRFGTCTHYGGDPTMATTFNFLGFTHLWARSRKGKAWFGSGRRRFAWRVRSKRLSTVSRHAALAPARAAPRLCQMLRGHFAYYGIRGNSKRLGSLHERARALLAELVVAQVAHSSLSWVRSGGYWSTFPLPRP